MHASRGSKEKSHPGFTHTLGLSNSPPRHYASLLFQESRHPHTPVPACQPDIPLIWLMHWEKKNPI